MVQKLLISTLPLCIAISTISIPNQSGTFTTIDQPTLMQHCHPNSIVYIRAHTWCCKQYDFGPLYSDMDLSLLYHTEYFHCPKNPLCSVYSFLSLAAPPQSWQPLIPLLPPLYIVSFVGRHMHVVYEEEGDR